MPQLCFKLDGELELAEKDAFLDASGWSLLDYAAEIAGLVEAWFARSQRALAPFFDPVTARLIDTYVEGLFTYRGLANVSSDGPEIRRALELLSGLAGAE